MRFSYIDSEGKEIEVDSVESLALRIELGAIEADTRMYDAVADRWAPAREHPVFRSLSRGEEVLEEEIVPIGGDGDGGEDVEAPPADAAEPPAEPAGAAEDPAGPADDPAEPASDPGESASDPGEAADDPAGPADDPSASPADPVAPADREGEASEPAPSGSAPAPEDSAPPSEAPESTPRAPASPSEDRAPAPEDPASPPEAPGSTPEAPAPAPDPEAESEPADAAPTGARPDEAADDPLELDFEVSVSDDAVDAPSPDPAAGGPEAAEEDGAAGGGDAGPAPDSVPAEGAGVGTGEEDGESDEDSGELPLLEPRPERPLDPNWTPSDEREDEAAEDREDAAGEPGPPAWAADEEALFSGEEPDPSADPAASGPAADGTEGGGGGAGLDEAADEELPPWARGTERSGEAGESGAGSPAGAASEDAAAAGPAPPREDRRPEGRDPSPRKGRSREASRPAHWDRRSRVRRLRTRIVRLASLLLVLGAVGAGAAYLLGVGPAGGGGEAPGETALPSLPPPLHDAMAEANAAAYDAALADVRGLLLDRDLPGGPPEGWLDGLYLARAGDYPEVREYWSAVLAAVEGARSREGEIFRERLDEQLEARTGASGLAEAEADRVREAGLAHYAAAAAERSAAYERLLGVAEASLELHRLLVEREADIAYEPYSSPGVSRDPVLEAVPSDSLLRAEMNRRVDRVLDGMDDAELPRPVTTAGLADHLIRELRSVDVVREAGEA